MAVGSPAPVLRPGHALGAARLRAAFSLLELVVVIVIIGVVAAIAIPRVQGFQDRAKVRALTETVRRINMKLADEWVATGEFPPTLDLTWLSGGSPENPLLPGEVGLEIASDRHHEHPDPLVWKSGGRPWWYNPANGMFRARVPPQGSQADTVMLYNAVNGANVRVGVGGQAGSDVIDAGDSDAQLGAEGDGKGGFAAASK